MGQKKTQRLLALFYQFSLLKPKQLIWLLSDTDNNFIICSDSLSVLKAMNHTSSKNPQIQKLLENCYKRLENKEIVLCWIPSHIGILGNEMVDQQAKHRFY